MAGYYTIDEHTRVPELQLVAQSTWDKLSPEYQNIIRECAQESAVYERKLWQEREKISEQKIREAGCVITGAVRGGESAVPGCGFPYV